MTIGFDATAYTFTESDSTVSRSVSGSVQSGFLARDVVVTVQTMDGTATGGFIINPCHIRTCTCVLHKLMYHIFICILSTSCISVKFNCNDGHVRQLVLFYRRLGNFLC